MDIAENMCLIRESIDIKEKIEKEFPLKKIGNAYFGKCPFCGDEELFSVNNQKGFYHCFECGDNGDVILFQMKYHSMPLIPAISTLSAEIGIEYTEQSKQNDSALIKKINRDALNFFRSSLLNCKEAKTYFEERKLSEDTIDDFELGYCGYEGIEKYLYTIGYTREELLVSGLFYETEGKLQNRFKNRVMFPIKNTSGEICGFGGRVMGDYKPKYLNSPDSDAFDKGSVLFGLDKAKDSPRDYIIICEGYMDVIAMHQAGYIEAVASLGTALTEAQVCLIKRYTDNVFLCYDMDAAGKDATAKAVKLFDKYKINVRIVNLNPYKDADEFLKKAGKNEFFNRLKEANHPVVFEAKYYIDNTSVKLDFANRMKSWVSKKKSIQKFLSKRRQMDLNFNYGEKEEQYIREISSLSTKKQLHDFIKRF